MTARIFLTFLFFGLTLALGHPIPENESWLTYSGEDGPGKGKHVILIAADQ